MTWLSRPQQSAAPATRGPLAQVAHLFSLLTRHSYVRITLLLLGIMILLQLSVSPLMLRLSSGDHVQWGLLRIGRNENSSNELQQSSTNNRSRRTNSQQDLLSTSAFHKDVKRPEANKVWTKQAEKLMTSGKHQPNKLRQKDGHQFPVLGNVYPQPKKDIPHKNNGRNILDLSARAISAIPESNKLLLTEKLKQYNMNLTTLLKKIPQPTPKPGAFDYVYPNASAQDLGEVKPVSGKPLCPAEPDNLVGPIKVIKANPPPMARIEAKFPDVSNGRWSPKNCTARHRVAIVIPYRDREEHLRIFLNHMHAFLQKQLVDYGIYIVEQAGKSRFNRAMLMNIGFVEAGRLYDNQCYIFHDVDLLPEDDRNLYYCPSQPTHMSAAVDTFAYKLPYAGLVGGVTAFKKEHFEDVNGFSNCFFGWGGEDDDMFNRMRKKGYRLHRYPLRIARYTMLRHVKAFMEDGRFKYLKDGWKRFKTDGLNSLKYKLLNVTRHRLYTSFTVELNETEVRRDFPLTPVTPPPPPQLPATQVPPEKHNAPGDAGDAGAAGEGKDGQESQNHYTVVKRSDLERILAQLRESASAPVNVAVNMGKLLGTKTEKVTLLDCKENCKDASGTSLFPQSAFKLLCYVVLCVT